MKIRSFSIYSIILLIETAKRNDELFTIRKFCEEQQISVNKIMKIVHFLSVNGYLETIRGNNGGFKLGKAASNIYIGKLLRLTEGFITVTKNSKYSEGINKLDEISNVNDIIVEAFEAMFAAFDKYTLADLIKNAQVLRLIKYETESFPLQVSYG